MKNIFLAGLVPVFALPAVSAVPQTFIYRNDGTFFHRLEGEASVRHEVVGRVPSIVFSENGQDVCLPAAAVDKIRLVSSDIPRLYIDVPDRPDLQQVDSKTDYLSATVRIDGNGMIDDMDAADVSVRGRGNSTWNLAKKPMRMKFAKKRELAGLKKGKNFVLLANYFDPSLMRNAAAMKIAELLGMDYSNRMVPCNVTFNGNDLGCFSLTNKVGINGASVDIDESKGILFELSTEFDEDFKFRSAIYDLPVMVKDPDLKEIAEDNLELGTADEIFNLWKTDFCDAESLVASGRGGEAFDLSAFVDYLLVYDLALNSEIGHPKSVYVYKEAVGAEYRYKFGPIWDFDSAFNYYVLRDGEVGHNPADGNLWLNPLFRELTDLPEFLPLYQERLRYFRDELYPLLDAYLSDLAEIMEPSAKANGVTWPGGEDFGWQYVVSSFDYEKETEALREWIAARIDYLADLYGI